MAKIVYIADVCKEIFAGGDVPKSALSYEKTAEYNVPIFSNGEKNCGLYGYTNNARVKEPSITVSARGTIGYTAIRTEPFVPVVRLITLTPKSEVIDLDYLFYATQNYKFEGSGTSIPQLTVPMLKKYKFQLPEMSRQKAIAVKFEKLDQLISLRKQQLAKLDELVKERFVEMFGTFPANPFRWSTGKIQDVVSDVRYGSSRPAVEGGKYPYLRMNNITYSGELDLHDTKRIDIPDSELDKCTVHRGDVLFNRTNSKELVGKTCVYNRDELMVLAGFVIRVRVNERIRPEILSAFLNMDFSKRMLIGMCKTAIGQANINAKELQNIDLYIPPIELQDQFVTLKNKIDQQKQAVQQSLEKLELLKKALMQEYFG